MALIDGDGGSAAMAEEEGVLGIVKELEKLKRQNEKLQLREEGVWDDPLDDLLNGLLDDCMHDPIDFLPDFIERMPLRLCQRHTRKRSSRSIRRRGRFGRFGNR